MKRAFDQTKDAQEEAFEAIKDGASTLIMGPGGSGKSTLIEKIRNHFEANNIRFAVTATTGQAALNIGGCTFHSFCGFGIAQGDLKSLEAKYMNNKYLLKRWNEIEVLIVDEISMLDPEYLDKVDHLARILRNTKKVMGGVQLVFLGDFFQLPPVQKNHSTPKFCFEVSQWPHYFDHIVFFDTIYRQKDPVFAALLNRVRLGTTHSSDHLILSSRVNAVLDGDVEPTRLVPTLDQARAINQQELAKIDAPLVTWKGRLGFLTADQVRMKKAGKLDPKPLREDKFTDHQLQLGDTLIKNTPIGEPLLSLKVGARVLLTVNLDATKGLVNGSRGIITSIQGTTVYVRFEEEHLIPPYTWSMEDPSSHGLITYRQIPLKLAYAITVHKSQSMSLDHVRIDLRRIFSEGQVYVALSRVKSLDGLTLDSYDAGDIKCNAKVQKYETLLRKALARGLQGKEAASWIRK